ncbi:MAG: SET domain-containing protein [Patescibacteria group bacterium]|nr:SET domain-containing protein [Patescibacteria group bacterium]
MFLIPSDWYQIKKTTNRGRGVFARHDIVAGTVIGDYLGTIMDPKKENEARDGLYTMVGGTTYDILGNPDTEGIHLINHSCANNCDLYPYQGHVLYFASRKIFQGEEITVNYWLYAPGEEATTCNMHVCHCEARNCTGTMHHAIAQFDPLETLWKKNFGVWYQKNIGPYQTKLLPLADYPRSIGKDYPNIYDLYASETKPSLKQSDTQLPPISELRKRIRETGQRLAFPKLGLTVFGIEKGMALVIK